MSPSLKYFGTLAILLLSSGLARSQDQVADGEEDSDEKSCTFNATTDLNATAFYLEAKAPRYRYPDSTGQLILDAADKDDAGLRIACPNGEIVSGNRATKLATSIVECVGGRAVKLDGTFFYSTLKLFGCDPTAEPTIRLTDRQAADGKKIIEIGYELTMAKKQEFLPVINDVAVNGYAGGYIPRWAHFKALPIESATPTGGKVEALLSSPLTAKVNFASVYDAAKQRNSFMRVFNDTTLVDKYLPDDGEHSFVAGQLVSQEDLYYENQRSAARYYEATVPVWKSVESGNWKRAAEVVRGLVQKSPSANVDVWSGAYLNLWLRDASNKVTYVSLPEGLKPSQFLFKYVHDATANRGIVVVTVNNPHLTEADGKNVICEEIPACRVQCPEFADFTQGYTYCCALKDFQGQAKRLGLPIFEDSDVLLV